MAAAYASLNVHCFSHIITPLAVSASAVCALLALELSSLGPYSLSSAIECAGWLALRLCESRVLVVYESTRLACKQGSPCLYLARRHYR